MKAILHSLILNYLTHVDVIYLLFGLEVVICHGM